MVRLKLRRNWCTHQKLRKCVVLQFLRSFGRSIGSALLCASIFFAHSLVSCLGSMFQAMYLSKKMLFILLCWISMIATAAANYCEWGYCSPSEVCCGDNQCCEDTKTTWILIGGLLSALIVASVCCACFYRHIEYYRLRMQCPFFSSNELLVPQTKA